MNGFGRVFGDLLQKDDGSATERFVYDGWNSNMAAPIGNENMNVVDRLDGTNAWQESYLWGNQVDQLLGRALLSANNFNLWPLEDRLGSIRDVINDAGTLKDSIAYDGFGNIQAGGPEKWSGVVLFAENCKHREAQLKERLPTPATILHKSLR